MLTIDLITQHYRFTLYILSAWGRARRIKDATGASWGWGPFVLGYTDLRALQRERFREALYQFFSAARTKQSEQTVPTAPGSSVLS